MTDALESLGWKQEIKFEDGIRMTIKWYEEHADHWQTEGQTLSTE
jgi:dTDP-D-glucose 4,6-dehydratase